MTDFFVYTQVNSKFGVLAKAGAPNLNQTKSASKQRLCRHRCFAPGFKVGDAGAAKNQFLSLLGYKLAKNGVYSCFDLFSNIGLWAIGGVFEWPMELAWKACKRENVSWVRIPPPPYSYFFEIFI